MKRLKQMKECLIACAQCEMGHLESVDAKELGEVIDMIKDLEEAIYYCTITKAMNEEPMHQIHHEKQYYPMPKVYPYDDMDEYYNVNGWDEDDRAYNPRVQYMKPPIYMEDRDDREGNSPIYRRKYMEGKELHHDKVKQMQELEDYMQELSKDITDMIKDASPEEKQLLQQKLGTLASKVKQ